VTADLVQKAVASIGRGDLAVIATDTVYGLVASATDEQGAARIRQAKGRPSDMPCALVADDVASLLSVVPEITGRLERIVRTLLPGPVTLIVPNPGGRFPWLAAPEAGSLGVRVPILPPLALAVVGAAGPIAATSANLHGESDPRSVDDLSVQLRASVAVVVDDGPVPGVPSTVIDITNPTPLFLREGAVNAGEVLQRLAAAG